VPRGITGQGESEGKHRPVRPREERASGEAVLRAGGVGLVLVNDEASRNELIADAHVLPAVQVYLNSTKVTNL
jgi:hypothetical protein